MSAGRPAMVAVLTFRRTPQLMALIPLLIAQARGVDRQVRILVIDNDPQAAARKSVTSLAEPLVDYVHEARPGIAAARNRALVGAREDELVVFIDDDEVPQPGWLTALLHLHDGTAACGIAGPVVSQYAHPPSDWIAAGRFFDRRRLATGARLDVAATNNLLLDVAQVRRLGVRFDEDFGLSGGSDTLFTRQLVAAGGVLLWCAEATVVDQVPASRLTRRWVLQKALRSGNSWSRTSLVMAAGPAARTGVRARSSTGGLVRVGGGAAQAVVGLATGDLGHRARGVRTAVRGVGMLAGAMGYVYSEYRRPDVHADAPGGLS